MIFFKVETSVRILLVAMLIMELAVENSYPLGKMIRTGRV